ncbi:hypothetical protein A374_07031 [Fictibacillus macauensis ZFHKF-1]|uniref:MFS transporter n=2 Tax=Fictibacillus TaxID=1329200 RepID=I8AKH0_9BACL|nr:hypothetical protein A374_07031 [Fictibacillus macauensis ZFHKF-1]
MKERKNLLFYIAGEAISSLGDVMSGLAFLFLAYDLTQSAWYTTLIALAQALPYVFFGLIGGAVADLVDRRRLLVIIDVIRVPIVASAVVLYSFGHLTYGYLVLIGFLLQTLGCFFNPAHRALLPMIASEEKRMVLNSVMDSVTRGIQVLSPFIVTALLAMGHTVYLLLVDACSYIVSAFCISKITLTTVKGSVRNDKVLLSVFKGLIQYIQWLKNQSALLLLYAMTFIVVFLHTWVWQVGLLLALIEHSKHPKEWFSMLEGIYGGVVIAVNIVLPFVWKKLSMTVYVSGAFIWGCGVVLLGFVSEPSFYIVCVVIVAIGVPIAGLSRVYLLQQWLPQDKLGRGFSFNAVLLYIANSASLALFGWLSYYVSVATLMKSCGLIMLVTTGYLLLRFARKTLGVMPNKRLKS